MNFDLRLPLGLIFVIFGGLLVGTGALGTGAAPHPTPGLNLNLQWGLVMLVFGGLMLALAARARRR